MIKKDHYNCKKIFKINEIKKILIETDSIFFNVKDNIIAHLKFKI